MKKVVIILTCFNRKEKTTKCIQSLAAAQVPDCHFVYLVVDDCSTDGTEAALLQLANEQQLSITVIQGTGSLFYTGGMNRGMVTARAQFQDADAYMLINDDVQFDSEALAQMVTDAFAQQVGRSEQQNRTAGVFVGATRDDAGKFSYGGVRYIKGIRYIPVKPEDADRSCDTFNANCVLVPRQIFDDVAVMDTAYMHSMGDFDYGLRIHKKGYPIMVYDRYIGVCNKNAVEGSWNDRTLSRKERFALKESNKGLPRKEWFHFLNRNFGFGTAVVRSITPYIRIVLGK